MESCGQPNRVGTDSRGHPPMGSLPQALIPPRATNPCGHPPMGSLTCEVIWSPVHMITHSHHHPPMLSPTHQVSNSHGNPLCSQQLKPVTHPHDHQPTWSPTHVTSKPWGHPPTQSPTHVTPNPWGTCPCSHQAVPSPTQTLASTAIRDSDV